MRNIVVVLFSFLCMSSFSQSEKWEKFKEVDGVIIDIILLECSDNEILTYKFTNTNNYNIVLDFFEEVWVDNICKKNGNSEEDKSTIHLRSNEIIVGSCSFQQSFYVGFKIKRGNSVMALTHFDLKNISVEIEK